MPLRRVRLPEKGDKVEGDVEDLGAPVVKGDEKKGPDAAKKTKKDATIPTAVKGDEAPQKLKEEDEEDDEEDKSDDSDKEEMDEKEDMPEMEKPKTGKEAEELIATYLKKANADQKKEMALAAGKCVGEGGYISSQKESLDIDSVDVSEDVKALVEGEDLSEEFTTNSQSLEKVKSKLRGEVERLEMESTQTVLKKSKHSRKN